MPHQHKTARKPVRRKALPVAGSTVQTNVRQLYRKLGTRPRMQAVDKARAHGLI